MGQAIGRRRLGLGPTTAILQEGEAESLHHCFLRSHGHGLQSEKFNFPVDGHNITGQFDPSVHGFDGFIGVSVPNAPRAIDGRIIQTTQELEEFPFKLDMNSGEHLGVGWVQSLIDRGVRSSSKAYLVAPDVAKRSNLDILLNAQVSRALRTSTTGSTIEFKGVEFKDRADGKYFSISLISEFV